MKVLALDLARQTGWAVGIPCGPPTFGTLKLNAPDEAARFLQLMTNVRRLIQEHGVDQVILEEPFVGYKTTKSALMPLFGYRACAMAAAKTLSVLTYMASAGTWRKHFIGHGGGKRVDAKAAVLDKCRWRGWAPRNNDEADALGLLDYRLAVLDEKHLVHGMTRR